jgi:hypothetical protein
MPRSLLTLLVALPGWLWLAPAAIAQEDGVFIDPGSPTGKEYAIPFESARREADPASGSGSGSGGGAAPGSAPLFGAGIAPSGASAGKTSGQAGGSAPGESSQQPAQTADGAGPAAEAPKSKEAKAALEAAIRTPGAPSGGLGTPAIVALLAAGLLLAGGLIGVAIRRARASADRAR